MPFKLKHAFFVLTLILSLWVVPREGSAQTPVRHYTNCDNSPLPASDLPEIDPPLPHFSVIATDSTPFYDGVVTIEKDYLLEVIPDPDFARNFPHDANYTISKVSLLKEVGEGAPLRIGSYKPRSEDAGRVLIPLTWFKEELQSGDRLWLAIDRVYRINYRRKKVWVRLPEHNLFIPLEIK